MNKVFEDHPEEIPMQNNEKVLFTGFQPYDKVSSLYLLKSLLMMEHTGSIVWLTEDILLKHR